MTQLLILIAIGIIWAIGAAIVAIVNDIQEWVDGLKRKRDQQEAELKRKKDLEKTKVEFMAGIREKLSSPGTPMVSTSPNYTALATGVAVKSAPSSNVDPRISLYGSQALRDGLDDLKSRGVSQLQNTWLHLFTIGAFSSAKVDETEQYLDSAFSALKPYSLKATLKRAIGLHKFKVQHPSSVFEESHKPLPISPTLEDVKERFSKWSPPFSTFSKQRFFLTEPELSEVLQVEINEWKKQKAKIDERNAEIDRDNSVRKRQFEMDVAEWNLQKDQFEKAIEQLGQSVDEELALLDAGNADVIVEALTIALRRMPYPSAFPFETTVAYMENKSAVIDFRLPSPDDMPTVKERRFLKTKDTVREIPYSERERIAMYDDALYKIALNCIRVAFASLETQVLEMVTVNGWVRYVDRAKGNETTSCVLSLQANRPTFSAINFEQVDAKACFKELKGISASRLINLTAIRPILEMQTEDKRFVESRDVADTMSNVTNVAAMPWEDFEHLIRGLFERYFERDGVQVKITRASRDGGVDAVFFDNDPIKGGKIVIQAKRYINTVGVEAVRDLYGTVHNEGAMKGILVTTADYSPEAYEFARGKPLTLLNGNNLLHMLNTCGIEARIDLNEARERFNAERTEHRNV